MDSRDKMTPPPSAPPKAATSANPASKDKNTPNWKKEQQNKPKEERAVNPMTMIPEDVAISGKMPLPPKAKQIKRIFGF